MIEAGSWVGIYSPGRRPRLKLRAMVMGVEDDRTVLLDRKLPADVRPGDVIILEDTNGIQWHSHS